MVGKFGKIGIAVAAGALAMGVAMSVRLANQPPPAFSPSAAKSGDVPASPADPDGPTRAELRESLKEGREQETAPMAQWPGVARREGDVLTIASDGHDLASFTDANYCDGFDQCSRWRFQGVWRLGGRDYPWLSFFHGEGWEMAYMIGESGELVGAQGEPSASPDGRWLVVAYDDPDTGGAVTVFEPGPRGLRSVAFSDLVACRAGAWKSDTRLEMTCTDSGEKDQRSLAVDLVRDSRGWRIKPRAELDAKTRLPLARPTRPLRDVDVPSVVSDRSGLEDTYEVEKGYRRL
ncbi:hypothetical protein BH10PSE3_BH10PSE3_27590 [soil metagenome]